MINVADLPTVRAQLAQDAAAAKSEPAVAAPDGCARAPVVGEAQATAGRPPAIQRSTR